MDEREEPNNCSGDNLKSIDAGNDSDNSEDATRDDMLDLSDDEQPKKRQRAHKRGDLRERIQSVVGPPVSVKDGKGKRKTLDLEEL
jgi:hypothetical protein